MAMCKTLQVPWMKLFLSLLCASIVMAARAWASEAPPLAARPLALRGEIMKPYLDSFNASDNELYPQCFDNASAWSLLGRGVPLLECPDKDIEEIYYFRWWTFRKHIKQTPDGFVITEFLPKVGWSGKHNTINCAAGHHLYEGRWLADPRYLDDYSVFWFRKGGEPRRYSFWAADALWNRYLVTGDKRLVVDLLPDLVSNFEAWEKTHRDPGGLFWQIDDRDGMEVSIGGSGYRATINSYMYGDAAAIARTADLAGKADLAAKYREKAARIKQLLQEKLWDPRDEFFKVSPRGAAVRLAAVRELHGYTPWYFNLPDPPMSVAWKQIMDPNGFWAPYGPTTAERRDHKFSLSYRGHECQWNGPSWPYSTSVTLVALANLLNNYRQEVVGVDGYFDLLKIYTKSHRLKREDGRVVPWIDENLHPLTGDWISRTRLKSWKNNTWDPGKGGVERGKDYNHSTYCDLVITGLIGLRPRADDTIEVNPLVPGGKWDYFCLDQVLYRGRSICILYDKTGQRYKRGAGFRVFADGQEIAVAENLGRLTAPLPVPAAKGRSETGPREPSPTHAQTPSSHSAAKEARTSPAETAGGWVKYENNPVLGGTHGTCFDVSVLREGDAYRMWVSWRPRKSVALAESKDGLHWSGPPRVVLGPNQETGWEDDVNRPVVIKRGDTYHMWYTGQARGSSRIGYATSADGVTWKRMSDKPVLAPEQPWEKVAVMCPHVIYDEEAKVYRMWYSGGEQYEPNAIGYAASPDGRKWVKHADNPIFRPDPRNAWEKHKVTACQVEKRGGWHLMFYIGFRDEAHAQIGIARSKDGITGWERHAANPIIRPGRDKWDHDACYKPYAIYDGRKWLLWYNGRRGGLEQIGVALRDGEDLGFWHGSRVGNNQ
jgi:predicted GH43/DUF377 family glycosyl hydrolase